MDPQQYPDEALNAGGFVTDSYNLFIVDVAGYVFLTSLAVRLSRPS